MAKELKKPARKTPVKKARNEKTSPRAATAASNVLGETRRLIGEFKQFQRTLSTAIQVLEDAETAAASALTQAPDKKRK